MPKKVVVGVVTSDKMNKTRVVEIPRLVKHPKYGRFLRKKTVCYVHDGEQQSHLGDTVEIVESRPRSRTKRWELVRVIAAGSQTDRVAQQREERLESEIPGLVPEPPVPESPTQEASAQESAVQETQS
jgi:small subunit ribosomal protein S17